MAETALNEAEWHGHLVVPLAAQPPVLRTSAVPHSSWPVSAANGQNTRTTRPDLWPGLTEGAEPVLQLARAWLTALAVNGDELSTERGDILPSCRASGLGPSRQESRPASPDCR